MQENFDVKREGIIFFVLILTICVSVSAILYFSLKNDAVSENLKIDTMIKTLFVVKDENEVLFSDVLIYYPPLQRGALIDIIGNTGAIFESLNRFDVISAVFSEKGISHFKREVEKLIDQNIPFTVVIDLKDLSEIADMIGGFKVFIPSPIDIFEKNGERYLLPSGAVNLDGDKTKTYMLFDDEENEDTKEDRRQNIMVSFLSALNQNKQLFLKKKNFHRFEKKMQSNLRGKDLLKLFSFIVEMDCERLVPQKITGKILDQNEKKILYPFYNGQLIKDVVKQSINFLISEENITNTRTYVLEIQNGTSVQGLARNTAALLQSAGYDVLNYVNATKSPFEIEVTNNFLNTAIVNHIGNEEAAKNLGNFIHCKNIVDEEVQNSEEDFSNATQVDFTVILGQDFDGRYVR